MSDDLDAATYIDCGSNQVEQTTGELLANDARWTWFADGKQNAMTMLKTNEPEPLIARLRRQKLQSEREVARLAELIKLLEDNPDVERILHLLGR